MYKNGDDIRRITKKINKSIVHDKVICVFINSIATEGILGGLEDFTFDLSTSSFPWQILQQYKVYS